MMFWIATGGATLIVAGLLLLALRRGGPAAAPGAAYDLQVYRDQLREVERERERGVVDADEAERLRAEVARRVLGADRDLAEAEAPREAPPAANRIAFALIAVAGLGALLLYDRLGLPGARDFPIAERLAEARQIRADRISQKQAEARLPAFKPPAGTDPQYLALIEKLREAVAARPDDLKGQELLVKHELRLGNYAAAWRAQAAVNRLRGPAATAADYAREAGMMILAVSGYVSPQAEAALDRALKSDPKDGAALYYVGLMYAQTGRPDYAFAIWQPLLARSKPTDPWVKPIRGQIEDAARLAGIDYRLPAGDGLPGPDAAAMAAAAKMDPAERRQMIRGMVAQLADRIDRRGGTAEEWARLIRAYGVLGEDRKQSEAIARAEAAFADRPADLARIEAAARTPLPATTGAGGGTGAADRGMGGTDATGPDAAAPRGPSAADVAAAGAMSPAERQTMIRGMVSSLAERIAAQGGSPAQWAQLLTAYSVLGETDKARTLWQRAQKVFAGRASDLEPVLRAARKAGLSG